MFEAKDDEEKILKWVCGGIGKDGKNLKWDGILEELKYW